MRSEADGLEELGKSAHQEAFADAEKAWREDAAARISESESALRKNYETVIAESAACHRSREIEWEQFRHNIEADRDRYRAEVEQLRSEL